MAQRASLRALLVLAVAFVALRLLWLDADIPPGITQSSDAYTDEGWYSNAAVSWHVTGRWYIPGDFNPVVNLPLFQIVQAAVMGVFGVNVVAARLSAAVSFVVVAALGYRLVARSFGATTGIVASLLLATNMVLFAYARFAIMELMMTALLLAALLALSGDGLRKRTVVSAASCLCSAILVKTTAVFAIPVLFLLVWSGRTARRERLVASGIIVAAVCVVIAYHLTARTLFPADYALFERHNVAERITLDGSSIIAHVRDAFAQGVVIDRIAYWPTLVLTPLAFLTTLRRSRVFAALVVWCVSDLALLSLTPYHPARYYVPLAVGMLLLLAIIVGALWHTGERRSMGLFALRLPLTAFIVLVLVVNATQVVDYMRAPRFSLIEMARDVRQRITASDQPDGLLMGDIANTVGLATAHPTINATWGTESVAVRLHRYQPAFYISLGHDRATERIIEADHDLVLLQTYTVMDNYYQGEPVYLYAIRPPTNDGSPDQRGVQE